MPFPDGYEEAQIGGSGERLLPGGHLCVIRAMRTEYSKAGNRMLVVEIDTDDADAQPVYYMNRYIAAYQAGKTPTWGGIYRAVVDERALDKNGDKYGLSNLKRLNTAISDSNPGFDLNDKFYEPDSSLQTPEAKINMERYCQQFKDLRLGVVFREEEYKDERTGQIRTSVKPFYVCDYAKAADEPIPNKKTLGRAPVPAPGVNGQEGFMMIPDELGDEGLPFR